MPEGVSDGERGQGFPAWEHPNPRIVLRKLLFHYVADNVVVNYLLLALLAVHEAVDAGLVDEPGAARRVAEDLLHRVIGEDVGY